MLFFVRPLLIRLGIKVAKQVASDPRVRAKAAQVYKEQVKPALKKGEDWIGPKVRAAKEEFEKIRAATALPQALCISADNEELRRLTNDSKLGQYDRWHWILLLDVHKETAERWCDENCRRKWVLCAVNGREVIGGATEFVLCLENPSEAIQINDFLRGMFLDR